MADLKLTTKAIVEAAAPHGFRMRTTEAAPAAMDACPCIIADTQAATFLMRTYLPEVLYVRRTTAGEWLVVFDSELVRRD